MAVPFNLAPLRDSVFSLAQDLAQKAELLRNDIRRRNGRADAGLQRVAQTQGDKAQAAAAEAAQALLGDEFILLPEFTLPTQRRAEWENVWSNRAALLAHLQSGAEAAPFPVEDWLHGIARVRERPRYLETVALLGAALGVNDDPTLEVLQFPYRADDAWLGLRFPETLPNGNPFTLEEDKLLYSGHFGPGAEIDPAQSEKTYSGLMLDEWVEVIPSDSETTGLAFHFNRPNSEAPQAILLATPPIHRGAWHWPDLVDMLHETLDFAQLRAVEPGQIEIRSLGPLIPAVLSAVTMFPITPTLNFALNAALLHKLAETDNG